jgi:RNA recognition motif-containing protein
MGDENIDVNLRNVLDPTTIFVGGLDVHGRCTWDEQRLKRVFGQYGEIAEVKLVRPGG